MKNELNTFKTLFEQVRGLGILNQLPNKAHTQLSENISVWFDENYNVTAVTFGDKINEQVEVMKYSTRDSYQKVSFSIDSTDKSLQDLIQIVSEEYRILKIKYLKDELVKLEGETV